MSTIAEHVSVIRHLIKQHSDDSIYPDELLYTLFKNAAAILNVRKARRFNKLTQWNEKTYCIGTCVDVSHDCDCVAVGCKVLKSVFPIPKPLVARNRDLIVVRTLDGRIVPQVTEDEVKSSKYDDIKKGTLMYSIKNQRIIIWNADTIKGRPKAFQVTGYWEDPTEWVGVQLCDVEGDPLGQCYDLDEDSFPLDKEYHSMAYDMVLQKLSVPLKLKDDITNDASETIKV